MPAIIDADARQLKPNTPMTSEKIPATTTRRDFVVGFSALVALPLLVLLDTAVSMLRGWRFGDAMEKAVVAAAGATVGITILLALLNPVRRFLARSWRQLALLMIVVGIM